MSIAEVVAVAERRGWGEQKMQRLQDVFNEVPTVTYNERRVAYTYADLSNWTQGAASSRIVNEPSPKPARKMQENDLWIAATAHCLGATLVTEDKDFCHLKDIWFSLLYVDQSDLRPQ